MLTRREKDVIKQCAKKYNVSAVFLFGSLVKKRKINGNDIDLGIKGINPGLFFKFYAELFKYLPRRVDLVDLDREDKYFIERVLEEGEVIYES